ncbi:MAG: putative lipid II flippase FtsW [bacterium]|nr:putative lipid II flippase FtsW [bacterium]
MISQRRPDSVFLGLVLVLCVFGIIILSSASSVASFQSLGDPNGFLKKQIISLVIGLLFMVLIMHFNISWLRKLALPLLIGSCVLMLAPFIPGLGSELLGARRWIAFSGFFFQPSELVKLTLVIFLAAWFSKQPVHAAEPKRILYPLLGLLGVITLVLIRQPDLGTAIVILALAVVMYFAAGAPAKHFVWIATLFLAGLFLLIQVAPYRAVRLTVFLNPDKDAQGAAYHINQSLLAIGSGGLFGRGLGHSMQKFNYLPEAEGDSIFAIAAEELGFFLSVGLIALYVGLWWRGIQLARRAGDAYVRLVIIGVVSWLTIQAFINIGALTSLLPLTGEPLPFISNGGSSLIISLVAVGILLNYSRTLRQ